MQKSITLVTPGHISSNPRLVKEAVAFSDAGFKVTVVFTQYVDYLVTHDDLILRNNPNWSALSQNWTGFSILSKFIRFRSGLLNKIWLWLSRFKKSPKIASHLMNRHLSWQIRQALQTNSDLFIAHNLGALPVCAAAGQKKKVPFAFDAEDFHRGEPFANTPEGWIVKAVEDKWIQTCQLTWCASPEIGTAYRQIFRNQSFLPVLNVFPSSCLANKNDIGVEKESGLKLFWFSQTIGIDRGLEDVFQAMGKIQDIPVILTLIGSVSPTVKTVLLHQIISRNADIDRIIFRDSVPEPELFNEGKKHSIGLALERNFPPNRDLCLTNKIFTYLSCGLSIIYSETTAQSAFWNENKETGSLYNPGNPDELANLLRFLFCNPDALLKQRIASLTLAKTQFNWETESKKILRLVNPVITKRTLD